ncbi:TetR/AcrR family transcriptional regulator [Roseibium sediminicola]|uniref:TetR/AcrR family transcriptional regulator n=1 Tax=Roseibium sediminicola TaxID=2933272 RepID=A0ABT0GTB2_9HYPH|nr:TetR/AcrR family transcriptional regulator [Roseibium sp. CAU 1639]MCK7612680.1 TetR/AcrR family transcriptional regulator [Roseibium sp. CAU 1639]
MTVRASSAKERILTTANKLFYAEGIRAVSLDVIAEKAGITKKTVYYHFKSKDDLIEAYLASRDQPNLTQFRKWFEAADGGLPEKVEAIFQNIAKAARHPKWKGCGFLRTAAELANMPGHPAMTVGAAHKKKFEDWMAAEFEVAGLDRPEALARHMVLLLDGTFSTILVHRDAAYADAAGEAAKALVAGAMGRAG